MITSKPLHQRLAWDRQKQPVVIPDWLHTYAHSWCNAGAKSVYLFGSRSNGYYLPDSDWDLAIVHANEGVEKFSPDGNICYPKGVEINEVHLTAEEICQLAQRGRNIAREIIRSKLIEGESFPIATRTHQPNREELKRHLSETFDNITSTSIRINDKWLRSGKEKELDNLSDHHAESYSAYVAERFVKGLCCIYEQEYELVHSKSELIKHLPKEYEALLWKMNGSTARLHVSPYENVPIESCRDSLNRVGYTLDLFVKIVKQGDMKLTHEETAHVEENHDPKHPHTYWERAEQNIHPDISIIRFRMDRLIEGLSTGGSHL